MPQEVTTEGLDFRALPVATVVVESCWEQPQRSSLAQVEASSAAELEPELLQSEGLRMQALSQLTTASAVDAAMAPDAMAVQALPALSEPHVPKPRQKAQCQEAVLDLACWKMPKDPQEQRVAEEAENPGALGIDSQEVLTEDEQALFLPRCDGCGE